MRCSILGLVLPSVCYFIAIIEDESSSNIVEEWRELLLSLQGLLSVLRPIMGVCGFENPSFFVGFVSLRP
jgi:hypothetical protein